MTTIKNELKRLYLYDLKVHTIEQFDGEISIMPRVMIDNNVLFPNRVTVILQVDVIDPATDTFIIQLDERAALDAEIDNVRDDLALSDFTDSEAILGALLDHTNDTLRTVLAKTTYEPFDLSSNRQTMIDNFC